MENPTKMHDLGVPLFQETSICVIIIYPILPILGCLLRNANWNSTMKLAERRVCRRMKWAIYTIARLCWISRGCTGSTFLSVYVSRCQLKLGTIHWPLPVSRIPTNCWLGTSCLLVQPSKCFVATFMNVLTHPFITLVITHFNPVEWATSHVHRSHGFPNRFPSADAPSRDLNAVFWHGWLNHA